MNCFRRTFFCHRFFTLILFCLSTNLLVFSQEDSLGIQLFDQNDLDLELGKKSKMITSANRLADRPEDMSEEVIIIDGDEIRKNGYATLVDVLKSIPGFRVSQPGNEMEGETFLMRGLYGNDHAKIMVNGIPLKPEAVRGMPIASNLPIRHAERIEIVLGPSSASYGTDAMAGVINIVLPEIDRPVFAWADVNIQTPRNTDFNLTLGGKVGKGKNILNYEIFASSYKAPNVRLNLPDDSIRVQPGELNEYEMALFKGENNLPERNQLRRESRIIGTYLKFRWFEVTVMNLYRNEHSGFGNNPLVHSYHDPTTMFGENINSFSIKYQDVREKRYMQKVILSSLQYKTLQNSSYYGISHTLSNGKNYMYARSTDFNAEYSGVLKVSSKWKMALGATADYSLSHPFTNFLAEPFKGNYETFNLPPEDQWLQTASQQNATIDSASSLGPAVFLERYTRYNFGAFIHGSFKSKKEKFRMNIGTRIDYNSFGGLVFTPKIGFLYKPNARLRFRGQFGSGYRSPRSYYLYNNYFAQYQNYLNGEDILRSKGDIRSERLYGIELSTDWNIDKYLSVSAGYFGHVMLNKVLTQLYSPDFNQVNPNDSLGVGFVNTGSVSVLNSLSARVRYQREFSKFSMDIMLNYQYSKGWELFNISNVSNDSLNLTEYRFMPEHMVKANLEFSAFKFTLSIRNQLIGRFVSDIYRYNNELTFHKTDKLFYNLDILLHKQLSRQLSVFGGVYNVLNSVQSGIPNINLSNSWSFNPQYGSIFRIGLTYQLN